MNAVATASPPGERARPARAIAASLVEQVGLSALQFAPIVASALSNRPQPLAWTASFTACTGLVIAVYRGAVVQPAVRSRLGAPTRFCGRSFAAVTAIVSSLLVLLGWLGVLNDQGSLIVLGLTAPLIGLVEMNRMTNTSRREKRQTGALAVALGLTLAFGPRLFGIDPSPTQLAMAWLFGWAALTLRFAFAARFSYPDFALRSTPEGRLSLTLNNLAGQLAAQGPLLLLAGTLPIASLSALQAARVPLRPVTVLAAALPVHYLPFLVAHRDSPARRRRSAIAIIGASAVLIASLATVAFVLLGRSANFADVSGIAVVIASVAALSAIAEAVVGVAAIASHRERAASAARLGSVAIASAALGAGLIGGWLDVEVGLVILAIGPALAAAVIGRSISWS